MSEIKSVCIFCGASDKVAKEYKDEAYRIGTMLAKKGYNMVFGAGDQGLMGAAANGCLDSGGTVTGVYPRILDGLEAEHKGLTETIIVDDMHTRKMTMFNRSDAFIILPGGFGTMDETFEVITWKQLHTHKKPIILYNYKNYWENWRTLTEHFIKLGFAGERTRTMYDIVNSADEIFEKLK